MHNWNYKKIHHLVCVGTTHINSPVSLLCFPFLLGGVGVGVRFVVLRLPVPFDVVAAGLGMASPALGLSLDVNTFRPDLVVIPLGIPPLVLFSEMGI